MKQTWCVLLLAATVCSWGMEYFVSPSGKDRNPGSAAQPFRTIGHGVNFIKGGDTLTILPGEYRECVDGARMASDPVRKTTIRAAIPGSVILRGDIEAPRFTRHAGSRFTYVAEYSGRLESVYERDSFTAYRESNSVDDLDYMRGAYCHDSKAGRLYVVTTNGKSPDRHYLTIPVVAENALTLGRYDPKRPLCNITIEGLVITGYNFSGNKRKGYIAPVCGIHGRYLRNCVIRDCDIFLCGAGIHLWRPRGTVIEDIRAYGNGSYYSGEGGNIVCYGPTYDNTIRNCLAFGSIGAGIRYYSAEIENCQIRHCTAGFNGYGDFWIKGTAKNSYITECTAIGSIYPSDYSREDPGERNNVYHWNGYYRSPSSLALHHNPIDCNACFADAENWDFRRQGDHQPSCGLQDQAPVHFIAPDGNDDNPGNSITAPWRTFARVQPGSTVYMLPGIHSGNLTITVPQVRIVTRGNSGSAVIKGGATGLTVRAPQVTVDRLVFQDQSGAGVEIQAPGAKVRRCTFGAMPVAIRDGRKKRPSLPAGGRAAAEDVTTLANNLFTGKPWTFSTGILFVHSCILPERGESGPEVATCFLHNAYPRRTSADEIGARAIAPQLQDDLTFRNAASFVGRGLLGYPIGPYRKLEYAEPATFTDMGVRKVSPVSANFEFFGPLNGGDHQLRFGKPGELRRQKPLQGIESPFYTYSITGLQPGQEYEYQFCTMQMPQLYFANQEVSAQQLAARKGWQFSPVGRFTTPRTDVPVREYHVSVKGSDQAPGTRELPFRTIRHAAEQLMPGDTVTVHQGTYNESIWLRSTGTPGRPITFRTAPGEKVSWQGGNQKLFFALRLMEKFNVTIDGFHMSNFGSRAKGALEFHGGADFLVRRIFYDGRCNNYTPGLIYSRECGPITLEHSFITRGFHGLWLQGCSHFTVRHNLFHVNQLTAMYIEHFKVPLDVHHNIFFDNDLQKQVGPTIGTHYPEVLNAEHNCFYWRIPATERLMAGTLLGKDRKKLTMAQYRKLHGGPETNFCANPQIKVTPEIITFGSMEERNAKYVELQAIENHVEHQKNKDGSYPPWTWQDVMPHNPQCIKGQDGLPVGPDPAALREIGLL